MSWLDFLTVVDLRTEPGFQVVFLIMELHNHVDTCLEARYPVVNERELLMKSRRDVERKFQFNLKGNNDPIKRRNPGIEEGGSYERN